MGQKVDVLKKSALVSLKNADFAMQSQSEQHFLPPTELHSPPSPSTEEALHSNFLSSEQFLIPGVFRHCPPLHFSQGSSQSSMVEQRDPHWLQKILEICMQLMTFSGLFRNLSSIWLQWQNPPSDPSFTKQVAVAWQSQLDVHRE